MIIPYFPRILVHAPVYETEAMLQAPKMSPSALFYFEKIGSFRIKVHVTEEIQNSATNLI